MTPEIRRILERAFGYAKGAAKRLGPPSAAELLAAEAAGYPADELEEWTHDMVIAHLHAARDRLAPEAITAAFIAGVGGSAPRGLQPLISYAFARHVPAHAATGTYEHCGTCGILREAEIDRGQELLRCHVGFLWNELPTDWAVDLDELVVIGPPVPTADDRAAFLRLLVAIDASPDDCTPSQLEKEIARLALLPHSRDKYQRYGIFEALAEVGVLPNRLIAPSWDRWVSLDERHAAHAKVRGSARSDIVLPFGDWRGALGVDWDRAEALFDVRRPSGRSAAKSAGTSKPKPTKKPTKKKTRSSR